MKTVLTCLALVALTPASVLLADIPKGPPALSHNPFARPPSVVLQQNATEIRGEVSMSGVPELQATMIGSVHKLANVSGRILEPGDEVQGYVLVAIHEQYAVFRRNGEDTKVYVKPLAEDDE